MARQPRVTWDFLYRKIDAGEGSGFGEYYQAWIKIKRSNPSKVSSQVFKKIPPFHRAFHFLSKAEYKLALIFSWAGCHFREQLPIWPWDHPHPETGREPEIERYLRPSAGTIELCKEAGIDHGCFVGTNIPYVWTMDFCMHLPWVENKTKANVMVSAKPSEQLDPENAYDHSRVLEKLEIERRYCQEIGSAYLVGDYGAFPTMLMINLDAIVSCAVIPQSHYAHQIKKSFLDKHGHQLQKEHLGFTNDVLKSDFKCSENVAALIQNNLIWNQVIDVDLSKSIMHSKAPIPGGISMRASLRNNLENA